MYSSPSRRRLHRYEGASHLLPEDAPQYAEAVAQWVRDLPLGNAAAPTAADGMRAPAPAERLWSALADRAADPSPAVVEIGGATVSWAALAQRVEHLAAGLAAA